jgi:hypothetical protein
MAGNAVGGSIQDLTLDGRTFSVANDADAQRGLGGYVNDVESNGNDTVRLLKTRQPWSVADLTVSVDDAAGDQQFLQDLEDANDFFAILVTYASGAIWQGTGQVVGEVNYSNSKATASVSLKGSGKLTQQP